MASIRNQMLAIESLGQDGMCHICGELGDLTREHTPSKKGGNVGPLQSLIVDESETNRTGWLNWRSEKIQGLTCKTLCKACNNNNGTWYNPSYLRFLRYCSKKALPGNAGALCSLSLQIYPQRLVKQALASLIATCQAGLTWKYPHLRQLLKERELKLSLEPLHLWLYLMADRRARTTGLAAKIDLKDRRASHCKPGGFWHGRQVDSAP